MVDRINDIVLQAHQGSVAAIIQLLNENLAHLGVRTRAVFSNGVLQLLCEAPTVEQLEKNHLIHEVKQILQSIAPRNVNRVNVNSRIVREEQLLWLEEINQDSENQLLWSEDIELEKSHLFNQLLKNITKEKLQKEQPNSSYIQTYQYGSIDDSNQNRAKAWKRLNVISSLGLLFLLMGIGISYFVWRDSFKLHFYRETFRYLTTTNKSVETKNLREDNKYLSEEQPNIEDNFVVAVRIANIASDKGKIARTSTEWLELAASWERASYLMGLVLPSHSRYQEAQIRVKLYKKYSEAAQKEAEKTQVLAN